MNTMAFFLAAALLGEVGWRPLPEGGVEYMIEITPAMLESLKSGQDIQSDVPPDVLREMRSYRISFGDKKLVRDMPLKPKAAPPEALPPNLPSNPLPSQQATFTQSPSAAISTAESKPEVKSPAKTPPPQTAGPPVEEKPWIPLWITVVALFASVGANIFLGWITWDVRSRYRSLLGQTGN